MRVYIAGPYTEGDTIVNVRNAIEAGDRVVQADHTAFVPHLYHFWHLLFPGDYEQWMRLCLDWLGTCDVLLRLPGDSDGADREVARARKIMPVFKGFGKEFWNELKKPFAGSRDEACLGHNGDEALRVLAENPGAVMFVDGGGEYVVSWRGP